MSRSLPPIDALQAELAAAVAQLDPVPSAVTDFARVALDLRTIDAELAELTYDSAADAEQALAVRGGGSPRMLSFEAGGLGIELEVTPAGDSRDFEGQLVPAQSAAIEIRHPHGTLSAEADEVGRFTARGVPAGPISLRCRLHAVAMATPVTTEWLPL